MNPRFEELYKSCRSKEALASQEQVQSANVLLGTEVEKFAELIVRECIRKCDGNHDYKNRTDTDFGKGVAMGITLAKAQISTHFGVEE